MYLDESAFVRCKPIPAVLAVRWLEALFAPRLPLGCVFRHCRFRVEHHRLVGLVREAIHLPRFAEVLIPRTTIFLPRFLLRLQ